MRFAHTPKAGELWCNKNDPSKMVLVLQIANSNNLVLTKPLWKDQQEGYRGMSTFRTMWRPVTKETQ